jgi:phenylacetate-CoA ligase
MSFKSFVLEKIVLKTGDLILNTNFIALLQTWRKTAALDQVALKKLQAKKLKKMLTIASEKSVFYKKLTIQPNADAITWLNEFPVLTKKVFRDNIEYIVTQKDKIGLTPIMSSGSTGPPAKVYFSKNELSNNRALQVLWWEWAGYQFGNSLLQTGVNMNRTREKKAKDFFLNTRYIDAMKHDEKQILEELNLLQKEPRKHFIAYASSLYLFAKTALEHKIKDVKFDSVVSLGEKLLPNFRDAIEQAFSCKVYDTYGASEGFLIASQCTEGKYHIVSPHVVVELLDDAGNEVRPGEIGRVVLTGLDNFSTPLIRYEVGDLAVKAISENCTCGLELPLLGEVIGRQTEFLLTPKGKYITVQTVVRILKQFPEIEQFKVVQSSESEFKLIYLSYKNKIDVREKGIRQMFEDVFEESLNFDFEKVSQLPKAKSGKFQLIENHVINTEKQ